MKKINKNISISICFFPPSIHSANNHSTMTVVQQQPQSTSANSTPHAAPGTSTSQPNSVVAVQPSTNVNSTANPSSSPSAGGAPVASGSVICQQPPLQPVLSSSKIMITSKPGTAVISHPLSPNHSSGSDTDPVLTTAAAAATALRRLYFKSGRNSRPKGPTVPMVTFLEFI